MGGLFKANNPNGHHYKAAKKLLTGQWMTIKQMIPIWPLKKMSLTPQQLVGSMQIWPVDKREIVVNRIRVNEYTWDEEKEARWLENKKRVESKMNESNKSKKNKKDGKE